ncbi:MAG: c-type cytochrome, partial [Nitrospirales bacterium]
MRGFIGTLCLLGFLLVDNGAIGQENTAVVLGRSIYESGIGRDGREVAAMVHGRVPLTGAAIACAGCHGRDGRGGREAFVRAPDIRWFSLSKPYPARRAGSAGVPYDQASFARTIQLGISPEGTRLDPTMPRFALADDEVGSLVAYLSTLRESPSSGKAQLAILGLLPMPEENTGMGSLAMKLQNCPANA